MPERPWRFRLEDMLESALVIREFVSGMSEEEFRKDRKTLDAVIRNLEVIGVASRYVPDEARDQMPEVAWSQIWGMRNRLVHDYPNIDVDIIWEMTRGRALEKMRSGRSEKN